MSKAPMKAIPVRGSSGKGNQITSTQQTQVADPEVTPIVLAISWMIFLTIFILNSKSKQWMLRINP